MYLVIRSVIGTAFAVLSFAYLVKLFVMVRAAFAYNVTDGLFFFVGGTVIFGAMWLFAWEKTRFFRTSIHERAHAIIFSLFGRKVTEMYITSEGIGHVRYMSNRRGPGVIDTIGLLAPYCLPYTVCLCLLFLPLLRPEVYNVFFFLLGAPTALHILISVTDFVTQTGAGSQSDIQKVGFTFSLVMVFFVNTVFYGAFLAIVMGGLPWCKDYIVGGLAAVKVIF